MQPFKRVGIDTPTSTGYVRKYVYTQGVWLRHSCFMIETPSVHAYVLMMLKKPSNKASKNIPCSICELSETHLQLNAIELVKAGPCS